MWKLRGQAISAAVLNMARSHHIDRMEKLVIANVDSTSRDWMHAAQAESDAAARNESLLGRVTSDPDYLRESKFSKSLRAAGTAGQIIASGYGVFEDHKRGESWGQAITSQAAAAGAGIVGGAAGGWIGSLSGKVTGLRLDPHSVQREPPPAPRSAGWAAKYSDKRSWEMSRLEGERSRRREVGRPFSIRWPLNENLLAGSFARAWPRRIDDLRWHRRCALGWWPWVGRWSWRMGSPIISRQGR